MDAPEEIGRTAPWHDPVSGLADDQGTTDIAESSRMADHGGSLHGRERQRHSAGPWAANILPSAPQDHGDDRRQGARLRILLSGSGARLYRRTRCELERSL